MTATHRNIKTVSSTSPEHSHHNTATTTYTTLTHSPLSDYLIHILFQLNLILAFQHTTTGKTNTTAKKEEPATKMYLPADLARSTLHPPMHGMTILGPDGNVRHEWFVWYKTLHPANKKTWAAVEVQEVLWEADLQQMHEGAFTVRYVLTALLNFHRKMLYWSDPDAVELDDAGRETTLLEQLAEVLLHKSLVHAMKQDGRSPLEWPDSQVELPGKPSRDPATGEALSERLRFLDMGEVSLAWEVAYLDKLDDILRDNGLEGANFALFDQLSLRHPQVETIDPLVVVRVPVWPPRPPAADRKADAHEMADKSVVRPTTRIHMREQYGDMYPHGEVQMA